MSRKSGKNKRPVGMNKEHLPKLNVQTFRDDMRKAKTQMEMNVAKDVKDTKKGFCKYISNKQKTSKNVDPLLNETWLHKAWKRLRY